MWLNLEGDKAVPITGTQIEKERQDMEGREVIPSRWIGTQLEQHQCSHYQNRQGRVDSSDFGIARRISNAQRIYMAGD